VLSVTFLFSFSFPRDRGTVTFINFPCMLFCVSGRGESHTTYYTRTNLICSPKTLNRGFAAKHAVRRAGIGQFVGPVHFPLPVSPGRRSPRNVPN